MNCIISPTGWHCAESIYLHHYSVEWYIAFVITRRPEEHMFRQVWMYGPNQGIFLCIIDRNDYTNPNLTITRTSNIFTCIYTCVGIWNFVRCLIVPFISIFTSFEIKYKLILWINGHPLHPSFNFRNGCKVVKGFGTRNLVSVCYMKAFCWKRVLCFQ